MSDASPARPEGRIARLWATLKRPTARYSLATLLVGGFAAGVVFWGGFNTAMEATNTMTFCISCHEMRENVYKEYDKTIHHSNRTGVQATCSDCHVPKEWTHKLVRKIQASNEVFHWLLGSVDTPEKFDAKRLTLAKNVWSSMKRTDSRECRNCHTLQSMNPEFQRPRARQQHLSAMETGGTCIDCHKGIAHKSVRAKLTDAELEELEKPLQQYVREIPQSYRDGLVRAAQREKDAEAKRQSEVDDKVKSAVAAAEARAAAAIAAAQKAAADAQAQTGAAAPATAAATAPAAPAAAAAAGPGKIDWAAAPAKTIGFFYPGQTSYEWVQNGRDHGGARAFLRGGDRCVTCHDKEVREMGAKLVSGEKAEATPIKGKRGSVDVQVQVAHDKEKIYFRFQFPKAPHTPVDGYADGKMDPANETKVSVMVSGPSIERAELAGCWVTCHHDARNMPDTPKDDALKAFAADAGLDLSNGVTKYVPESRSAIELREAPRGGWNKLKSKDELAKLVAEGGAMELMRYRSGGDPEHGLIAAQRVMTGLSPIEASGGLAGDTWTVVIARALKGAAPGEIALEPGKKYVVSFALHEDFTASRFHHVSLAYELSLDGEGELVAKAQ
ncbi:MAG: NapC/NirT family cytochrome c [Methylobacteriaceae bacterium]|nr:NapC/NirT family cytochrome c [Methylobacteriaceae bacterium]